MCNRSGVDAAAALNGKHKGTQTVLAPTSPHSLSLRCAAHCLNLLLARCSDRLNSKLFWSYSGCYLFLPIFSQAYSCTAQSYSAKIHRKLFSETHRSLGTEMSREKRCRREVLPNLSCNTCLPCIHCSIPIAAKCLEGRMIAFREESL